MADEHSPETPTTRPSVRSVVVTGIVVGLAIGFIAFFLVAMPIYMVRSIDLAGDARTFVRNGVLRVAIPVGLLSAVVGGAVVGRWRWQGGRLSETGRRDSPGVTGPVGR